MFRKSSGVHPTLHPQRVREVPRRGVPLLRLRLKRYGWLPDVLRGVSVLQGRCAGKVDIDGMRQRVCRDYYYFCAVVFGGRRGWRTWGKTVKVSRVGEQRVKNFTTFS